MNLRSDPDDQCPTCGCLTECPEGLLQRQFDAFNKLWRAFLIVFVQALVALGAAMWGWLR